MLDVLQITKKYEGQLLLKGVSFRVAAGETVCLLGPSGSGKSTLLRLISGLEQPDGGQILWDGRDLAAEPVHRRQFGLMFQEYALFPHRSVAENVAFGLRMQGISGDETHRRVQQALEQVNLAGFDRRQVTDLSGGEQQRVALARALAPRPRLLMLDEPLGALDRTLREQLLQELHALLNRTGIPAIYVTHDQEEAFALADRMILLHQGCVEQDGTPAEVVKTPVSAWAARFLGMSNLLPGLVSQLNPLCVRTLLGDFEVEAGVGAGWALQPPVNLLLRPGGARLQPPGAILRGTVSDCTFRGERFRVELDCAGGQRFTFSLDQNFAVGQAVCFYLPPEGVTCLRMEPADE
jgi:ABC-type Fe3+/spermidine/putrescine transport system ATPase subunit